MKLTEKNKYIIVIPILTLIVTPAYVYLIMHMGDRLEPDMDEENNLDIPPIDEWNDNYLHNFGEATYNWYYGDEQIFETTIAFGQSIIISEKIFYPGYKEFADILYENSVDYDGVDYTITDYIYNWVEEDQSLFNGTSAYIYHVDDINVGYSQTAQWIFTEDEGDQYFKYYYTDYGLLYDLTMYSEDYAAITIELISRPSDVFIIPTEEKDECDMEIPPLDQWNKNYREFFESATYDWFYGDNHIATMNISFGNWFNVTGLIYNETNIQEFENDFFDIDENMTEFFVDAVEYEQNVFNGTSAYTYHADPEDVRLINIPQQPRWVFRVDEWNEYFRYYYTADGLLYDLLLMGQDYTSITIKVVSVVIG